MIMGMRQFLEIPHFLLPQDLARRYCGRSPTASLGARSYEDRVASVKQGCSKSNITVVVEHGLGGEAQAFPIYHVAGQGHRDNLARVEQEHAKVEVARLGKEGDIASVDRRKTGIQKDAAIWRRIIGSYDPGEISVTEQIDAGGAKGTTGGAGERAGEDYIATVIDHRAEGGIREEDLEVPAAGRGVAAVG